MNTDRATIANMESEGQTDTLRKCDGCGRIIPKTAKLAVKEPDGRDLCLACQIREAQIVKGLRH